MCTKVGKLNAVSAEHNYFLNRAEAGKLLAHELQEYKSEKPVVLGIPRGGVAVAWEIANDIGCDMDLLLCHKLRAPENPEVAIGAVTERGKVFIHEVAAFPFISREYIEKEKEYQIRSIQDRIKHYRAYLPKIPLKKRVVVVVDDGVAMGFTLEAALWAAREEKPRKLIAAIPVGPKETLERLTREADQTICLCVPEFFGAVSQFYLDFPPVEDEEVIEILRAESLRRIQMKHAHCSHGRQTTHSRRLL